MASDTVTLALNGSLALNGVIPLAVFAEEIRHWSEMLRALSVEISKDTPINWYVEELHLGSAVAMARGEADDPGQVERVIRAYSEVGRALQGNMIVPFSDKIRRHAEALVQPIGATVLSIRFETAEDDITISAQEGESRPRPALLRAYGAITGRIQTLSSRKRLSFTLYDALFDKAVTCYLNEGQEPLIRDKWDRRAQVDGHVSRDPETGRPVIVRNITNIVTLPEGDQGNYRLARGVIPLRPGDERPEETLRRLRNAW